VNAILIAAVAVLLLALALVRARRRRAVTLPRVVWGYRGRMHRRARGWLHD
jgi:hypothetical protein